MVELDVLLEMEVLDLDLFMPAAFGVDADSDMLRVQCRPL